MENDCQNALYFVTFELFNTLKKRLCVCEQEVCKDVSNDFD